MNLINRQNSIREFYINGMICSSAIQFISTTGKKPKGKKPPNPVLPKCTIEYLKGSVNTHLYNF